MKVQHYPSRRDGNTLIVAAGPAVDRDFQGGLEEQILKQLKDRSVQHLRVQLGGMRFLHATLTAGLLSLQLHLEQRGGTLQLADAPWFVRAMMRKWGVARRFLWSGGEAAAPRGSNAARALLQKAKPLLAGGGEELERIIG